jgi:hypothetical protein
MKRTKLKRFQSLQEIKKEGGAQLKRGTKFWGPKSKYRKLVDRSVKTGSLRVKTTRRLAERRDDVKGDSPVVWP